MHQWPNGYRVTIQVQDRFAGGKITNLFFNFFKGSNKEIMVRELKKEVL